MLLRLRLPVGEKDSACPFCHAVNDSFGDHARSCPCGGDRTKRHNRLRSVLAARAQAAGLHPEVEKPDLLPPRPDEAGAPEDGQRAAGARRPADVWVGNWGLHGPAAFDLAVTSGLRQGTAAQTLSDPDKTAADYEARKRGYQSTAAQCQAVGLQFVPLVAEAIGGGWGPTATKTWGELAQAIGAKSGEGTAVEADRLFQTLAVTLQRENARAVLRRAGTPVEATARLADP